jgi:hypothetical protein
MCTISRRDDIWATLNDHFDLIIIGVASLVQEYFLKRQQLA